MSVQPSPVFELSVELAGPIHHDFAQLNTTLLDGLAMFAVKNRLMLEEAVANFVGIRRKCGKLYACYHIRNARNVRHKDQA